MRFFLSAVIRSISRFICRCSVTMLARRTKNELCSNFCSLKNTIHRPLPLLPSYPPNFLQLYRLNEKGGGGNKKRKGNKKKIEEEYVEIRDRWQVQNYARFVASLLFIVIFPTLSNFQLEKKVRKKERRRTKSSVSRYLSSYLYNFVLFSVNSSFESFENL